MSICLPSRRLTALSWISTLSSFSRPGAIADFSHGYRLLQSLDYCLWDWTNVVFAVWWIRSRRRRHSIATRRHCARLPSVASRSWASRFWHSWFPLQVADDLAMREVVVVSEPALLFSRSMIHPAARIETDFPPSATWTAGKAHRHRMSKRSAVPLSSLWNPWTLVLRLK